MVPSLVDSSGHQNCATGKNTEGWGALRIKNLLVEEVGIWLHEHPLSTKVNRTKERLVALALTGFSDGSSHDLRAELLSLLLI